MVETYQLGELFSGPGGLALGAHLAAGDVPGQAIAHAWAMDYDRSTCDTYIQNIPGAHDESVHCADVREFDFDTLPPIDAFAFGFPCNDFSAAGKRKGVDGTYGPLYTYGVRILRTHQPKWFIAENVAGLLSANERRAFDMILNDMADAGYTLTPHLYSFDQYGVPQVRKRVIIVGIRNDIDVTFRVPSPAIYSDIDVSAGHALTDPPIAEDAPNNEMPRTTSVVAERLSHIAPGKNIWQSDIPAHLQLGTRGVQMSLIYRRLHPDQPSYTVTGSGGGGTHMYHWEEPRALTNRERARIQSFPDDFVFCGGKESVRRQIGMAVPVDGAAAVVRAVLSSFAGVDYPSIPANITFVPGADADVIEFPSTASGELAA